MTTKLNVTILFEQGEYYECMVTNEFTGESYIESFTHNMLKEPHIKVSYGETYMNHWG